MITIERSNEVFQFEETEDGFICYEHCVECWHGNGQHHLHKHGPLLKKWILTKEQAQEFLSQEEDDLEEFAEQICSVLLLSQSPEVGIYDFV